MTRVIHVIRYFELLIASIVLSSRPGVVHIIQTIKMNSNKDNMLKDDQDNIQAKESTLRQPDIQQCEHTCQSEQDNHSKSRINMLRQSRELINIISMLVSQMDIAVKQRKSSYQTLNVL